MHNWQFSMVTPERGTVTFKVKANDKKTAIQKAFAKVQKMNVTTTAYWDCKLIRN